MLIIDNYDSFTYNIVQYIKILGVEPIVIKNDELTIDEIQNLEFERIIISPGWGEPSNSGVCMEVIDRFKELKPIFGICLGMQCIAKYFGVDIIKDTNPYHGKNSEIFFDKDFELFKDFRQGFSATRYHSLKVAGGTDIVKIKAWTRDNIPMALKIENKNIFGVQFHPEAILTENGIDIFRNFLLLQN